MAGRYRDAAIGFVRVREAKDAFAATAAAHDRIEASLDALVREALRSSGYTADRRRAVRAIIDPRVWQSLLDAGLDTNRAHRALQKVIAAL